MGAGLIRIATDQIAVTVSALGAEMQNLQDARGREYLWNGDPAFWSGRSPILFPIVGRAPEDRISLGDHSAPMAQHGFARRSRFALVAHDPCSCTHELTPTPEIRAVWPREFRLRVTHRVAGNTLSVQAEVCNRDHRPMPFGLGFHPAFRWPLPGAGEQPHIVTLDNGATPGMARLSGGLLPPERHPSPFENGRLVLEQSLFDADAMIFPEGAGTGLRYGPEADPALRFRFDNLPNLALWTKPGAPFVCIEPWHGMAARLGGSDQIADRPYALTLPAGDRQVFGWSVGVEPAGA